MFPRHLPVAKQSVRAGGRRDERFDVFERKAIAASRQMSMAERYFVPTTSSSSYFTPYSKISMRVSHSIGICTVTLKPSCRSRSK